MFGDFLYIYISGFSKTQSKLPYQTPTTIFWSDKFQLHKLVLKPFKTLSMLPQSGVCSCTQQAVILPVSSQPPQAQVKYEHELLKTTSSSNPLLPLP
jgi:hypothetical protein